ncbi:MAG: cytochrome ubiquinol oxidase subunit I [Proteobacteria bacterium]|nr:cytochrome ubiquinol oxidase subunit I [Pseudomonadota bacterium]MBU1610203.1 cytochrome ubiquinol oxidase subunit I [Pseudomonadota bacterium]
MDALMLSRLQFAAATMFHFIFVPLTLGLSILIAWMETKYVRTGDEVYKRMAKFWGKIFLINFAVGVVTGITLEFQFGTNWSKYSAYVGDIFGSLLAIEATAAFFLESTFVGVWAFGWNKLSPRMHCVAAWCVAGASNLSAIWILIANGFMQNPVGYQIVDGPMGPKAELTDFMAVLLNPWGWLEFFHVVPAALALGAFFLVGVSAYHLLQPVKQEEFIRSFKIGIVVALLASGFVAAEGHLHGNNVAKLQPAKLAAMEAHFETTDWAPMALLVIPGQKENSLEAIKIPGLLSILAFNDPTATVKGLNDFPEEDRPPVVITHLAFRVMVIFGTLMIAAATFGWLKRKNITDYPTYLRTMIFFIPVPYLAIQAGWIVAEVGRQPWIVYGLMRTADAVSPVQGSQVAMSLFMFLTIYALLGACGIYLMYRAARQGVVTE